jgi:hypothetical protein
MWFLYLDESGDLGFDFVNKKPSRYFTITILALRGVDKNRLLSKAVEITKRRKFKNKRCPELKGSSCPINIKRYFYQKIKDIKFAIYAITLNKIKVYENLRKDKERVYNYIARHVLDKIPFDKADIRIEIIIDKSKTKNNIREFNNYIVRQIKSKFDPKVPLDIYHRNSTEVSCLQAVDLFSWGIFRKHEKKDTEWYDIFKEKIFYDEQYL